MPILPYTSASSPNPSVPIATKTSNYTIVISDGIILGDTTSANFTITLPDATTCKGKEYTIKKIDSTDNYMTVNTIGGQTIDGVSPMYIGMPNSSYQLRSDGTNWRII